MVKLRNCMVALAAVIFAAGCAHNADGVFDILDYGADRSGKKLSTAAIQSAIDACSEAGGGGRFHGAESGRGESGGSAERKARFRGDLGPRTRLLSGRSGMDHGGAYESDEELPGAFSGGRQHSLRLFGKSPVCEDPDPG